MRFYVLFVGIIETLIWIGVTVWAMRQPKYVDIAGLHAFFFACTVPGLTLALFNRALKTAVTLVSITAFIYFCVAAASQISG